MAGKEDIWRQDCNLIILADLVLSDAAQIASYRWRHDVFPFYDLMTGKRTEAI
jgi:hypothetical protein